MSEFFRIIGNGEDEVTEIVHHFPIGAKVRLVRRFRNGVHMYEDAEDDNDPLVQFVDSRHVEPETGEGQA